MPGSVGHLLVDFLNFHDQIIPVALAFYVMFQALFIRNGEAPFTWIEVYFLEKIIK